MTHCIFKTRTPWRPSGSWGWAALAMSLFLASVLPRGECMPCNKCCSSSTITSISPSQCKTMHDQTLQCSKMRVVINIRIYMQCTDRWEQEQETSWLASRSPLPHKARRLCQQVLPASHPSILRSCANASSYNHNVLICLPSCLPSLAMASRQRSLAFVTT